MTRYALRLSARNVRGVVQIPSVATRNAALAIAREWSQTLGAAWSVELVDSDGNSLWRV